MYIYNVTFLVENGSESEFLSWLRNNALEKLVNEESPARSPRLTLVTEVPGDPEFARQACSFALQMEFADIAGAHRWADIFLTPVLASYNGRFGAEKALSFSTILQEIDL